jgi:hypothetical protein
MKESLYDLLIKVLSYTIDSGVYPAGCGSEKWPCTKEQYPEDMSAWEEVKPGVLKRNKYGDGSNDAKFEIMSRVLEIMGEVCPETSEEGKKLWEDIEKFEKENPEFWKIRSQNWEHMKYGRT